MSLRKIEARVSGDVEVLGSFDSITVYGLELDDVFSPVTVEDDVFAKLKGNPHIEVREPKKAKEPAAPVAEAAPSADEPPAQA